MALSAPTPDAVPLQGAAVARTDAALRTLQGQLELRRDAEEPRSSRVGKWAVLQGLQKKPSYNGKLICVGLQRADHRFETARPGFREDGSREELAVRPENLRWLSVEFNGLAAGDAVVFDGGDIVLLGFDPVTAYWACKQEMSRLEDSVRFQYVWVPEMHLRG